MNTYLLKIANGYGGRSATLQVTAPTIPAAIVLVCLSEGCQPADVLEVAWRGGTKYESTTQPGLFYWAEPNDIDGGKTWCVVGQADGYAATEAWDDWFGKYTDADQVAEKLARGDL